MKNISFVIATVSMFLVFGLFNSLNADSIDRCYSCHGKHFEKKALGKSKVVSNMQLSEIELALNGYKEGNYGGTLKRLMTTQLNSVKDLKDTALRVYHLNHKSDINVTNNKLKTLIKKNRQKIVIINDGGTKKEHDNIVEAIKNIDLK